MGDWIGYRPIDRSVEEIIAALMPQLGTSGVMFFPNPVEACLLVAESDVQVFEDLLRSKNLYYAVTRDNNAPMVGAMVARPVPQPSPQPQPSPVPSRASRVTRNQPSEGWRPPAPHSNIPDPESRTGIQGYVQEVVARLDIMTPGQVEEVPFGQGTQIQPTQGRQWLVNRVVGLTTRSSVREAVGRINWTNPVREGQNYVRDRVRQANRMNADFIQAEQQTAEVLSTRVKNAPSIVSLLTTCLLSNTDSHVLNVKDKIRLLTENYELEMKGFSKKIGEYQAFKFASQQRNKVLAELTTGEQVEERRKMFLLYSELLADVTPEELEKQFVARTQELFVPMQVSESVKSIEAYIKRMVSIEQEIFATGALLTASVRDREQLYMEKFQKQIADISKFPFIEEFKAVGDTITFRTVPVEIPYESQVYPLGPYDVTIYPKVRVDLSNRYGESGTWIRIRNGHRPAAMNPHPHISGSDGISICWGNIREGVKKIFAEWDFPMLVNIVWSYLHSYTPTDKFCDIGRVCTEVGFGKPYPKRGAK